MSTEPTQPTTPKPTVTVQAHPDDWQSILAAVFQGITVVGPFVIQLIKATEDQPATVTVHQ